MRGIGFGRRCWSLGPTISMRMMYWRLVSIRRWKDIVLHHIEDVVCEAEERSRVDVDSEIVPKARAFSRTALIRRFTAILSKPVEVERREEQPEEN